ncbi:MAG: hypothetical protein LH632_22630 [Rhodoferax sp.]|nr:hypothetical protein [Rhodoferax sp.]
MTEEANADADADTTVTAVEVAVAVGGPGGVGQPEPPAKPKPLPLSHYLWVALIARIYEVFPLICPMCGGQMRIIAIRFCCGRYAAAA